MTAAKALKLLPEIVTEEVTEKETQHLDIEKRTAQYVEVRDAIARLKEEHEQQLAPFLEIKELLGAKIQRFMNDHGLQNLKTPAGTCYVTDHYTASVADGEAFMSLVREGNWELIERRANSTAVRAWVEEHKSVPAGVNLAVTQHLGVRRPTTKK